MEEKSFVSRVNQLDAALLDNEISKIIYEQLENVYKQLPPGILSKYQPEIDVVLKSLIWFFSINKNKSTFGQQILAISYHKDKLTRNRLIAHYFLTVFIPYAKQISQLRLTNQLKIQNTVSWIECCTKALAVLNFFRFLKIGIYPSLIDYCLKWNHVSENGSRRRNIGYAFMNRELIWTGFLVCSFLLLSIFFKIYLYSSLSGAFECHPATNKHPRVKTKSRRSFKTSKIRRNSNSQRTTDPYHQHKMCNLHSTSIATSPHQLPSRLLLFLSERKRCGGFEFPVSNL